MITRPGLILRYLLTIMAIMSVPPVLPPREKTMPIPMPPIIAPNTAERNVSSINGSLIKPGVTPNKRVATSMLKMVLTPKLAPNTLIAIRIRNTLTTKYDKATGILLL